MLLGMDGKLELPVRGIRGQISTLKSSLWSIIKNGCKLTTESQHYFQQFANGLLDKVSQTIYTKNLESDIYTNIIDSLILDSIIELFLTS